MRGRRVGLAMSCEVVVPEEEEGRRRAPLGMERRAVRGLMIELRMSLRRSLGWICS